MDLLSAVIQLPPPRGFTNKQLFYLVAVQTNNDQVTGPQVSVLGAGLAAKDR